MLSQLLFALLFAAGAGAFAWQISRIRKNINLGRPDERSGHAKERLRNMVLVALGQQKMFQRWIPATLHLILYVSFVVINIEVLEIVIDGLAGQHRILGQYFGGLYDVLMVINECLGALVIVASVMLLIRRNVLKVKRFQGIEMTESKGLILRRNYSHLDANIILFTEIALMLALFAFNIADIQLHALGAGMLETLPGVYPVSQTLADMQIFGTNVETLHAIERVGWWGHIAGILLFLNYLPISKHFHILMAFPNVYFSNVGIKPKGQFANLEQVSEEIKAVVDPSYTPKELENAPLRFGARDVTDLSWKSLMDSYTCTECGRCTSVCPANTTGKKLSPRKIVMDVRDRLEEIQKFGLIKNEQGEMIPGKEVAGAEEAAAHLLLSDHYISEEELRACTTCNACVEACPVNIDHLDIILPLRQYLVMEESSMPDEWGIMFSNVENNGAPWAMASADRFNWASEIPSLEGSSEKVE
ncbi:MAG: (Fe-S)-binding protein [Bacteroidia bacterium]|nr:(Fe-S)-binding protein [Bacteroidia bacterium]